MSGTILISGLIGVAIILILLFFKLSDDENKKHFLLQLIFLGFLIGVMVLIGKTGVDYQDNCNWLVNNSNVSGSITTYNYIYSCSANVNTTAITFYKVTIWIMRITGIYLFLYFAYELFLYFGRKKKGEEN